jgi:UDP-glucose 4-epimerase
VGNFAETVCAVAGRAWAGVHEHLTADVPALSTVEFARRVGVALGRAPVLIPVPAAVLRGVGRVGTAIQRVAPFPFNTTAVERYLGSLVVDDAPLRAILGPVPAAGLDHALALTAAWYRRQHAGGGGAHGG